MHATLTMKWERSVICSRHFSEAFIDLFGAVFLCLKDHFCVSRIILSHVKIQKSDGRVSERKIDWLIGDEENISKLSKVSTNIVTIIWPSFFHFLSFIIRALDYRTCDNSIACIVITGIIFWLRSLYIVLSYQRTSILRGAIWRWGIPV